MFSLDIAASPSLILPSAYFSRTTNKLPMPLIFRVILLLPSLSYRLGKKRSNVLNKANIYLPRSRSIPLSLFFCSRFLLFSCAVLPGCPVSRIFPRGGFFTCSSTDYFVDTVDGVGLSATVLLSVSLSSLSSDKL